MTIAANTCPNPHLTDRQCMRMKRFLYSHLSRSYVDHNLHLEMASKQTSLSHTEEKKEERKKERESGRYRLLPAHLSQHCHILAARPLGHSILSFGPRLRYGQHMIYIGSRPRFALGLMVLVDN